MATMIGGAAGLRQQSRLQIACVACVGLYALAMGFLVVAIYREDHTVNWALAVFCIAGVAVAALVATTASWSIWVAAAYSILTTVADAPHQVRELAHPTGHAPASAIIILVGLAAIVTSLLAAVRSRR